MNEFPAGALTLVPKPTDDSPKYRELSNSASKYVNGKPAAEINLSSGNLICENCETRNTPLWRRLEGKILCNACGLYYKLHRKPRPISMKTDVIRKRQRDSTKTVSSRSKPKRKIVSATYDVDSINCLDRPVMECTETLPPPLSLHSPLPSLYVSATNSYLPSPSYPACFSVDSSDRPVRIS